MQSGGPSNKLMCGASALFGSLEYSWDLAAVVGERRSNKEKISFYRGWRQQVAAAIISMAGRHRCEGIGCWGAGVRCIGCRLGAALDVSPQPHHNNTVSTPPFTGVITPDRHFNSF